MAEDLPENYNYIIYYEVIFKPENKVFNKLHPIICIKKQCWSDVTWEYILSTNHLVFKTVREAEQVANELQKIILLANKINCL